MFQQKIYTRVQKRTVLAASAFSSFITPFMGSSVTVALPTIARDFNANATSAAWTITGFMLGAAMFLIPFGKIADIYGRKRVYVAGCFFSAIFVIACGFAPSLFFLLLFRFLHGVSCACIFSTGGAILASVYPPQERGKAFGINVAFIYLGGSVGPFIGGILTQYLSWRSIFFFAAIMAFSASFMVHKFIKDEWKQGGRLDIKASALCAISLAFSIYGFSFITDKNGIISFVIGLIGLIIFILWQAKTPIPIFPIKLFSKNLTFAMSNLAAFINYCATAAIAFLLAYYLQYIRGLNANISGIILVSQPLVMAFLSPFMGKLSDKVAPRILASWGMFIITIGLGYYSFLSETTPFYLIIITLIFMGLGFALFSSPNTNAVMTSVSQRYFGAANTALSLMRLTGQMLSIAIAQVVFAIIIGHIQITYEVHASLLKSIKYSFASFAVLCAFGIWASLARGKRR
ncbi:MAG: MFS transporter [Endomicrobium sp.]|jgi:MFS family permease|nr:MFS transporter [Endomicrobium sp.]